MKKILSALLILTILLPCLVACDSMQNFLSTIESSLESSNSDIQIETIENISEQQQSEKSSAVNCGILSYEGIVALFKNIVDLYPSYNEEKMLSSECDGIDLIADETKELYKKLFISGYRFYLEEYAYKYQEDGRNYFGYTVTDLNKNGSEELILLTDLYDIIAIFSLEENRPKLLLDNYEKNYRCRIDGQGKIYTQGIESANLYTQIYSLNEYDNLVLEEEYLCVRYNYLDHDECYNITNGEEISISKSEWSEITHGWIYGNSAGIITKTNANFNFIRLFGELNLYLPGIYIWEWNSFQFYTNENTLFISNLSDRTVSFALYDTFCSPYQHKVSVEATLNGNISTFDSEEISGRLEFGLDSVWLIIDESNISGVPSGTFLYTEFSYSKG